MSQGWPVVSGDHATQLPDSALQKWWQSCPMKRHALARDERNRILATLHGAVALGSVVDVSRRPTETCWKDTRLVHHAPACRNHEDILSTARHTEY